MPKNLTHDEAAQHALHPTPTLTALRHAKNSRRGHRRNEGETTLPAKRVRNFCATVSVYWVAAVVAVSSSCAGTAVSVRLEPEQHTTLHVGEIVALHVPSERQYTIGSAASSLVLVKRMQKQGATIYLYRAARTGDQTMVATPGGLQAGQCVSCVTTHYFVTVLP